MAPTLRQGAIVWAICLRHAIAGDPTEPDNLELPGLTRAIEPGDVIVVQWPGRPPGVQAIKRVIAFPGDRVRIESETIYLNGTPVRRTRLPDWEFFQDNKSVMVRRWRETLMNGRGYEVIFGARPGPPETTNEQLIPSGMLFVLGDNRDNSLDSRLPTFGLVPFADVVGLVVLDDAQLSRYLERLQQQIIEQRTKARQHAGR